MNHPHSVANYVKKMMNFRKKSTKSTKRFRMQRQALSNSTIPFVNLNGMYLIKFRTEFPASLTKPISS